MVPPDCCCPGEGRHRRDCGMSRAGGATAIMEHVARLARELPCQRSPKRYATTNVAAQPYQAAVPRGAQVRAGPTLQRGMHAAHCGHGKRTAAFPPSLQQARVHGPDLFGRRVPQPHLAKMGQHPRDLVAVAFAVVARTPNPTGQPRTQRSRYSPTVSRPGSTSSCRRTRSSASMCAPRTRPLGGRTRATTPCATCPTPGP